MKYDKSKLEAALEFLRGLDIAALTEEFLKKEHAAAPGCHFRLVIAPADGDYRFCVSPSRECSSEEFFRESGIISEFTAAASTTTWGKPSPDEGFEWEDGSDYLWDGVRADSWISRDEAPEKARKIFESKFPGRGWEISFDPFEFLKSIGWQSFSVSSTPVDGWWNQYTHDEIKGNIQLVIDSIEMELSEVESR